VFDNLFDYTKLEAMESEEKTSHKERITITTSHQIWERITITTSHQRWERINKKKPA
jgi:hypothetical protein